MVGEPECLEQGTEYVARKKIIGEIDIYIERKRTAGMGTDFLRVAKLALRKTLVLEEGEVTRFRISLKTPSEFITDVQNNAINNAPEFQDMTWTHTSIVGVQYELSPTWNAEASDENSWLIQLMTDLKFTNARLKTEMINEMTTKDWNTRGIFVPSDQLPFMIDDRISESKAGSVQLVPLEEVGDDGSSPMCSDMDHDKVDRNGNNCRVYRSLDTRVMCGRWDTGEFKALEVCCSCGGGGPGWGPWLLISLGIAAFGIGVPGWITYKKIKKHQQRMKPRTPPKPPTPKPPAPVFSMAGEVGETVNKVTMRSQEELDSEQLCTLPPKTRFSVLGVGSGRRLFVHVDGTPEDPSVHLDGWISTQTQGGDVLLVRKG